MFKVLNFEVVLHLCCLGWITVIVSYAKGTELELVPTRATIDFHADEYPKYNMYNSNVMR